MVSRALPVLPALLLLLLMPAASASQDYAFSVPEFVCTVEVLTNGAISVYYEISFHCAPGAAPVDVVDVGLPTGRFDPSDVHVEMDGQTVQDVRRSTVLEHGIEAHLGGLSVQPDSIGVLVVTAICGAMVQPDAQRSDYASLVFTPTWFDGGLLLDGSDFCLGLVFPPGVGPEETVYHERPFTEAYVDDQERVIFVWEERRRVDSPYTVGVSFPAAAVGGTAALREQAEPGREQSLIAVAVGGMTILWIAVVAAVVTRAVRRSVRRKKRYLPPRIGMEGSGIRRGLTAPMAALLLEEDLSRVLLLVVYGMVRKGALELRRGGEGEVSLVPSGARPPLRSYELRLLEIMESDPDRPGADALEELFVGMIGDLSEMMEGYSAERTREYYRLVIDNAFRTVAAELPGEKLAEELESRFQWLLASGDFERRAAGLGVAVPLPSSSALRSIAGSRTGGAVSIAEACVAVAGTLESAASGFAGSLSGLSARVTSITNPVVSSARSSGGSCACACACAGCACACAGGGR